MKIKTNRQVEIKDGKVVGILEGDSCFKIKTSNHMQKATAEDVQEFCKNKFTEYKMKDGKLTGTPGKEKVRNKSKITLLEERIKLLEEHIGSSEERIKTLEQNMYAKV